MQQYADIYLLQSHSTLLFIYQHMHNFLKYNVKPQIVKTLKLH